jgi:16S rRNA (cytosine1402-N4)-methyltransferase
MEQLLTEAGAQGVDGIAFDLGMSSIQLDAAERGFSFRAEGPLDMRMDPGVGTTAADVVNTLPEEGLADILYAYGEERAARRIARLIVQARRQAPFVGTRQLADLVRGVVRKEARIDPATRTFQALRIYVNDELGELDRGLCAAERLLAAGGRLCVVAYHSLEDRKVKAFLRVRSGSSSRSSRHAPELPASGKSAPAPSFRLLHQGAVRPSAAEVAVNPRARSARLRAAERTAAPPWPGTPSTRRAA